MISIVNRILKLRRELNRIVRTYIDTYLTKHASPKVVVVANQHLAAFARRLVLDHLGSDGDGVVGTIHLAQSASDTFVWVGHCQSSAKTGRYFERISIVGVLLGNLLCEELSTRNAKSRKQRFDAKEQRADITSFLFHI